MHKLLLGVKSIMAADGVNCITIVLQSCRSEEYDTLILLARLCPRNALP